MLLALLFRAFICARLTPHERDWYAFDALGLSRCLRCRKTMDQPPLARRTRL